MKFLLSLGILAGCHSATVFDTGQINNADGTQTIYVNENSGGFDADGGDTVIVVMYQDGNDPAPRCDDMGGKLHYVNRIAYCVDIDF